MTDKIWKLDLAKTKELDDGDLMIENPNHSQSAWRPYHEEEASESESESEDEAIEVVDLVQSLSVIHV